MPEFTDPEAIRLTQREHLLMEAAQLIWECLDPVYYPVDNSVPPEPYWSAREFGGVGQLRADAREAAPYLEAAHDLFEQIAGAPPAEFGLAYDFEFAPAFCEACLHPDHAGPGRAFGVDPNWRDWVKAYAKKADEIDQRREFKSYARDAFEYLWGCTPAVVAADLDALYEARDLTESRMARAALDAVEQFGLDLDLNSTDPIARMSMQRQPRFAHFLAKAIE